MSSRYNQAMELRGIFPPLTTPFASEGSVTLDRLRENLAKYNRTRLAGYVITGSTGEAVLLRFDEIERIWATAREAAGAGKILIAGTAVESTSETIVRTKRAAELGFRVALVRTPYYYKPQMTPEAEAEYFLRVADAARIPILIYSVPQFTGLALEAGVVARLAQHPNILGIKESSGNVQRVTEIAASAPRDFQTLVGSASTLYASIAVGAIGGILALACVLPELCVELHEAAASGDRDHARALQQRLLEPAATIVSRLGIPGVKYAMDQRGYYGGPPRAPLLPLTETQKKEIEAALSGVAAAAASN
jgi:4-hydroxy-2-oxoglutarate aldolase